MIVVQSGNQSRQEFPGNKTGPWLFVIMINDWDVGAPKMWKYVDDTSMVETIKKGDVRIIQDSVDELAEQALANKFQLNQGKCKELRIGFTKSGTYFDPIKMNDSLWRWYSVLRSWV